MAYIRAAQAGDYSATSTWVGGVVPTSSDIACCGSFRVNLDITDITATLSTTNTDWVAAGGSALSTTHSGGFDISGASARNIAGFRYSFYRSAGTGATNAQLTVNAGDVTIGALTQVADTSGGTAQGVIYLNNSTAVSLSLGNVTCLDWSTYGSCYLVDLTRSTTPTGALTLTTRAFNSPSGLGANHALLFTNSYAGAVNWTMLAPLPRGATGFPCVNFGSTTVAMTVTMPSDGYPIDCTGVGSPNGGYVVTSSRCTSLTFSNSVYAQNGGRVSTNPMFNVYNDTSTGTVTFNSWVYIDNVTLLLAADRMVVDFKGTLTLVSRVSNKYLLSCGGSALAGAWHFRGAFLFSNASTATSGLGTTTPILGLPHYAPVRFYSTFTANGYTTTLYAVSATSYNGGVYPITFDGVVDLTAAIVGDGSSDGDNCYWVVSGSGTDSMRSFVFNAQVKLPTSSVGATGDGKAFLCVLGGVTSTGSVIQFLGGVVSGVTPLVSTFKAFAAQITLVGADNTGGTVPLITARCGYAFTPVLVSGTVKPSTSGVRPVQAPYTLTGSYSLYDANTSGVQAYALATGAVVPAASDVRKGVRVGSVTGTLSVPNAGHVLKDMQVDATVGTLDLFTRVSDMLEHIDGTPTTMYGVDPLWSSVTLHLRGDSKLGTFVGGRCAMIRSGTTPYSDASMPLFGEPSLSLANGYFYTYAPTTELQPVTGQSDFTVEFWVYPTVLPQSSGLASVQMLLNIHGCMNLEFTNTLSLGLWSSSSYANFYATSPDNVVTLNAWQHISLTREGNNLYVHVNGVRVIAYTSSTSSLIGTSAAWYFGYDSGTSVRKLYGYMQDITVTDGVARYVQALHTPPIGVYPFNGTASSGGTSIMTRLNYILQKTDKFGFDVDNNVLAAATVDMSGLTPRFNTIDANLATANTGITASNTAVAGIKAKTDQLAFGAGGVVAQTSSVDYATRFDDLETLIGNVPTTDYTTRLDAIDTQLDTIQSIAAGGGVDLTPVTSSLIGLDNKVSAVKVKTDQMAFTTGGVVADVTVSVQQAIDYSARFTALDNATAAIKGKTDQLIFLTDGVKAAATVDMTAVGQRFDDIILELGNKAEQATLTTRFNAVDAQLDTIQNATGAVDFSPILTAIADTYTQVMQIPRLTYNTSFGTVNTKLDNLTSNMGTVDLQPVLDAVANLPTVDLNPVHTKLNLMQTDLNTLKDTATRTEVLSNTIKAQLTHATGVDLSGVEHQLTLLNSKFDGVDAPVKVVPAGGDGTTVLYAYCLDLDGTPVAGQVASIEVAQVVGDGTLLPNHTLQSTSNADGLVSFVLPRNAGISVIFSYRGRKERLTLVDSATQALPSIVAKL